MRDSLKNLGMRILLLLTKSFVYLWHKLLQPLWIKIEEPLKIYGQWVAYIGLLALTPPYLLYRRVKKIITELKLSPAPLLKLVVHRYSLHSLIIFLAAITVYTNVTYGEAAINEQMEDPLILQLVETDVSFEAPGTEEILSVEGEEKEDGIDFEAPTPLLSYSGESAFQPYLPIPGTSVAPRQGIEEYIVEEGDTLAGIAAKFRLSLDTLLTVNKLSARSLLQIGQKLSILPTDGLVHTVKRGENIGGLARLYSVSSESILSFNRIADERSVVIGQTLIIPGGKAPTPVAVRRPSTSSSITSPINIPAAIDSGAKLLWPTVSHRINQYFTYRHNGLDINGKTGVPVYASESGVVLISGWQSGYGNTVLIKHDNGLVTRYGHASKLLVKKGERVTRGQSIMLIGSTGRSTGPHLHYEVLVGNRRVNPFIYTK